MIESTEPIHEWFGLTYFNYAVLQRSILQSMSLDWQRKFVALLEEVDEAVWDLEEMPFKYMVQGRDIEGKFVHDPYADYQRGRRKIKLRKANEGNSGSC
tara:strand:- start:2951 stop:3247 length:297 start_codon:yes stop_codon:yes gene_type:complete